MGREEGRKVKGVSELEKRLEKEGGRDGVEAGGGGSSRKSSKARLERKFGRWEQVGEGGEEGAEGGEEEGVWGERVGEEDGWREEGGRVKEEEKEGGDVGMVEEGEGAG